MAYRKPEPHEHIYEDHWYPFSRNEIWRRCVYPHCSHFQTKKVTG